MARRMGSLVGRDDQIIDRYEILHDPQHSVMGAHMGVERGYCTRESGMVFGTTALCTAGRMDQKRLLTYTEFHGQTD